MSKKTIAIYNGLDKLDCLQTKLEAFGNTVFFTNDENDADKYKELSNIAFELKQETNTLRFWIDSLYKYNGKSTSISKRNASANNGKKGGRPPKEISQMKKRIIELENEIIPDLDHKIVMADSNEELENLKNDREKANDELFACHKKIIQWNLNKK